MAVIKKKVKPVLTAVSLVKFNHCAPYKKVSSRMPKPPIEKGITERIEETKKINKYATIAVSTATALRIHQTASNCANCTKAEYPKDFQKTGSI